MADNRIPVSFNDKSRQRIDRLTRRLVSVCGIGILLVMLVLFFWLVWVVTPLFISPSLYSQSKGQIWQQDSAVAGGINSGQQWTWRIGSEGKGRFLPLDAGPPPAATNLSAAVKLAASDQRDGSTVLIDRQGDLYLVMPDFSSERPQWRFPLGAAPLMRAMGTARAASLTRLADNSWQLVLAQPQTVQVFRFAAGDRPQTLSISAAGVDQLVQSPDGGFIYALAGAELNVWQRGDSGFRLRDDLRLPSAPRQMALLSGGRSLLLADDKGVSQWFDITGDSAIRLQQIRTFPDSGDSGRVIVEAQRRVFATLSAQGELRLFASKQYQPLLQRQLAPGITAAWFAPQGNGLWVERQDNWQYYSLNNPWPDISWRNFWQKIWYENYPAPDYVWQSTAAEDNYQGKYSLVPLISGTLKAALMAMVIATPLALAAAMYTAWFMSPRMRRYVKPGIEMMGALPTVVVGLIASFWLAPLLAQRMSGIIMLPFLLAGGLLLMHPLSTLSVKRGWRWLFAPGREMLLLFPLLLLVIAFSLLAIPWLERLIWPQGLLACWGINYQSGNLLVAAIAMGFALVPLIFTLAEDALFSVPVSLANGSLALGATSWQTLRRVILPGASAGIFAALMIGFGRAMGETMIVLMATSNTPQTGGSLFSGLRTLSANVAIEMPEAAAGSAHYRILFLSALILLMFTLLVNTLAELLRQRLRARFAAGEGLE
ncbi:phosphate ABC transporter permease [Izhakiella australiensis]|uniref:Phosphate ABC transporter permease n=1 Tax=Izhakiella australiensis TaxID=1926881 RepID=A0A1S8YJC4_9GAMM|nr:ABC transporter permease subunit [Izhakiella australiensis]OON39005.1 phosphate ABC transporter permease [Izhakiella australiensis]